MDERTAMKDYTYSDMLISFDTNEGMWKIFDENDKHWGWAQSVRVAKEVIRTFRVAGIKSTKRRTA